MSSYYFRFVRNGRVVWRPRALTSKLPDDKIGGSSTMKEATIENKGLFVSDAEFPSNKFTD